MRVGLNGYGTYPHQTRSNDRLPPNSEEELPLKRLMLTTALTVLLVSCSGGGGSSDTVTTTTTTPTGKANTAPTVSSANADQSGQVGYAFSYDATQNGSTFTDANGDTLTYSVTFTPAGSGLTASNGQISGTPASADTFSVSVTATDPSGASVSDNFDLEITIDQSAIQSVFGGAIDLENLANYASQPVPNYITKLNDGGNPITDAGATLGRVLFYDTSLSIDDTVSCSSCHLQSHGFSDPDIQSGGVQNGLTRRHSMRLINTMFADETQFFWDERAASHEAQESMPIQDHNEMGFSGLNGRDDLGDLILQMEATEYYEELFRFVFLDPEITEERIQLALAQFVKSIHSFDSKYDTGRAQVNNNNANFPNFTAAENAGKTMFTNGPNQGGAGCNACHRAPEFDIRPGSGMNGVFREAGSVATFDLTSTRSPSLRDLVAPDGAPNGPFMHDGSLDTLLDVVNHYDQIEEPASEPPLSDWRAAIDNRLFPNGNPQNLNLSDAEKQQIIAFLETLTGQNVYTDTKWSDPF